MAVQPLADGMDGNLGRLLPGETEYARRDAANRDGLQMMRGGSLQAGRVAGGELRFLLGKGWYMGRFGFGEEKDKIYGDRMQLLCEAHLEYADGRGEVIGSDESWQVSPSPYLESGILDGEHLDMTITPCWQSAVLCPPPEGKPEDRLALPVKIGKVFREYTLIRTPKDELVLDFGQNMAGFAQFVSTLPKGRKVELLYGEEDG